MYHIVFDVHNVLFEPVYYKIIRIIIKAPYKLQFLMHICNPFFLYALLIRIRKYGLGITLFNSITLKYPTLKVYQNTCVELASAQRPIKSVFELIKSLEYRYKLHIFSNMDKQTFSNLYNSYTSYFEYFKIMLYCGPLTQWYQKPHPKGYQILISLLSTHPSNIIFIDNVHANVMTAQRLCINVHQYKNNKQLVAFLKKLNVE